MVVSVINLTRTALINADFDRRMDLLIDLAALEGIRIYPAEATDELAPLADTPPCACSLPTYVGSSADPYPLRLALEDAGRLLGELPSRSRTTPTMNTG